LAYVNAALIGIFAGGAYALVAVSITLMFRSTGVLSFAHAAFAAVGAYVYSDLAGSREWPEPLAALVALVVTVAYGLAVERVAIRPVRNGSSTTKLIATLGVLSLTTGLLLWYYGFEPTSSPLLLPDRIVHIGSLRVTYQQVAILVAAALLAGGLAWFLQRSRFGTAVRAVAQNAEAARLMGVSLAQVARFNWALGAALAGLTGILIAPLQVVTVATFPLVLAKALTATLFGGLISLPLTFAGGLVVGVLESVIVLRTSAPGAREVATLVLVVVLLVARRSWAAESLDEPAFAAPGSLGRLFQPVMDSLARARRLARPLMVPALVCAATVAVVVPARSNYWGFVGARGLFYVIEALSLVLLVGWGGQVSLMHGAYVGIGAFMTAYLVGVHHFALPLAVVGAGVSAMVIGALAGLPALRLTGLQFGIASLAFAGAASEWLFKRPEFPKSLPRGELFGLDLFPDSHLYLVMLPVTMVLYLLVWNIRRSTFGPLLLSSRDAASTVAHFGANPKRTRMAAFLLASFIAGLGGGLYGVLLTGFQPFDFSLLLSIGLLLYAVVGGVTSLAGPILAGLLFGVVPQIIQGQSGQSASALPDVFAGALVIGLLAFRPGGLAALFERSPGTGHRDADAVPSVPRLGRFDLVIRGHNNQLKQAPVASPAKRVRRGRPKVPA
jgi:branched-chain amino acid transport system permease protein